MKTTPVTVVRIYTYERSELLPVVIHYLQNEMKVRGISVFRAVSGFGETGTRSTSALDLSFSLPLIIEFFDEPDKINLALEHLATVVKSEHMIFYPASIAL